MPFLDHVSPFWMIFIKLDCRFLRDETRRRTPVSKHHGTTNIISTAYDSKSVNLYPHKFSKTFSAKHIVNRSLVLSPHMLFLRMFAIKGGVARAATIDVIRRKTT